MPTHLNTQEGVTWALRRRGDAQRGGMSLPCAPLLAGVPWPLSPRRLAEVKPGDTLQRLLQPQPGAMATGQCLRRPPWMISTPLTGPTLAGAPLWAAVSLCRV